MTALILAILPGLALMAFIYWKDPQKEPLSWIIKAFCLGMASAVLASIIEGPAELIVNIFFGSIPIMNSLATAFCVAAIPEECAKLLMLYFIVKKNPYFDEYVDGIVYAVSVGLGFAVLENVLYVVGSEDWATIGIMRALLAVPGHYAFAVLMGYFYALYHFDANKNQKKKYYILLAPVLAHGIYDSLCMLQSEELPLLSIALFIILIIFVYRLHKFCYKRINEMNEKDEDNDQIKKFKDYLKNTFDNSRQ